MKKEIKIDHQTELIRLLIVESSESDAIAIGEMLAESKEYEFDLYHASNLMEASEVMSTETIQLVLLNLFLPDSYGIYTFNDLFNKYPLIPFVVITEFADLHIGKNAVNKGAQDFLVKNELNGDQLLRSIAYALERKHTEEQLRSSEEKFRNLFLQSKDVIYMSTVDGKFIDLNPAGKRLLGYDETELEAIGVGDLH